MPKESVYGSPLAFDENDPRKAIVEVRWNRDQYVQVVSKCVDAQTGADGVRVMSDATGTDVREISLGGFYVDLDRQAINDLIRHLRRARDQAFGRDE